MPTDPGYIQTGDHPTYYDTDTPSYESVQSVQNDTSEPVKVWWQQWERTALKDPQTSAHDRDQADKDHHDPFSWKTWKVHPVKGLWFPKEARTRRETKWMQQLKPNDESEEHICHGNGWEVCVQQSFSKYRSPITCKKTEPPPWAWTRFNLKVSEIAPKPDVMFLETLQAPFSSSCSQSVIAAFALEPSSDCEVNFVPDVLAVASFMLGLIGLKKFYCCQKPLQRLQGSLLHM